MDVEEAIRTRRSIGKVKPDAVDKTLIQNLLDAATWAPCHYHTEPWKFIVMMGEGRSKLGEGYARVCAETLTDVTGEQLQERLAKERQKAFRAPVVIAAVCTPSDDPRVARVEELAAAHAAVQNMLLSAHACGLASIWRSGEPMYHPLMKESLGLDARDEIVGLVYIGYPDISPPAGKRTPAAVKTIWLE
ncbi:nitroreductase [Paenibacillus tarimensis]